VKNIHITITGDLGSGKSTIARILCERLDYEYYSTGNIQRAIAAELKIDTLQLNYLSEKDASIDKLIDDKTIALNQSVQTIILDSRLAWHFLKPSFKLYLKVDAIVAANRVVADTIRKNEPNAKTVEEISANLLERRTAENNRFLDKYKVHCEDMNNYDCVIDTTNLGIEEVVDEVMKAYNEFTLK
jgi:CMP/dCMP kinase